MNQFHDCKQPEVLFFSPRGIGVCSLFLRLCDKFLELGLGLPFAFKMGACVLSPLFSNLLISFNQISFLMLLFRKIIIPL